MIEQTPGRDTDRRAHFSDTVITVEFSLPESARPVSDIGDLYDLLRSDPKGVSFFTIPRLLTDGVTSWLKGLPQNSEPELTDQKISFIAQRLLYGTFDEMASNILYHDLLELPQDLRHKVEYGERGAEEFNALVQEKCRTLPEGKLRAAITAELLQQHESPTLQVERSNRSYSQDQFYQDWHRAKNSDPGLQLQKDFGMGSFWIANVFSSANWQPERITYTVSVLELARRKEPFGRG